MVATEVLSTAADRVKGTPNEAILASVSARVELLSADVKTAGGRGKRLMRKELGNIEAGLRQFVYGGSSLAGALDTFGVLPKQPE